MRIYLAGGTGFVGGHLRQALLARGHSIRLLVRKKGGGKEPGVEEVEGDVTDLPSFIDTAKNCEAAINLVGIIREFPERGITFERLHVEATRNMISAAKSAGIKRYLHMSALGARPGSTSGYFQSKNLAEKEVLRSGLEFTIFRPSIIFGPKDDFVNKVAEYLRLFPVMPVLGDGKYQLQPISANDVARCFAEALEKPETIGQSYELCGADRMSYNSLLDIIARTLGKRNVTKIHHPLTLVRLVVPLFERFSFFPITSDQITMLVQGNTCDGSWRKTFQFQPTEFEESIRSYLKP